MREHGKPLEDKHRLDFFTSTQSDTIVSPKTRQPTENEAITSSPKTRPKEAATTSQGQQHENPDDVSTSNMTSLTSASTRSLRRATSFECDFCSFMANDDDGLLEHMFNMHGVARQPIEKDDGESGKVGLQMDFAILYFKLFSSKSRL